MIVFISEQKFISVSMLDLFPISVPPYWTPYGERYHYVWKGCDSTNSCLQKQIDMQKHCKRDWYDDWSCIECCSGDLCNYYVTVGIILEFL